MSTTDGYNTWYREPQTTDTTKQSKETYGFFKCMSCIYYLGGVKCEKNVFIAYSGCDTSQCGKYKQGKICRHCGRAT